jgi:hypothetical protein
MFENYLCINGKKTELTDEQMRQLGIAPIEPVEGEIANEIAKMSRISKAGEAADHYNVHDTIVVDGLTFEIVGIGHDIDALTGKYNTITLRQVDHIKKSRINPGPCPDGFAASELDNSLMKSPQNWIPESILPYVRNVAKKYVTYDGHIKVVYRKLWLFSESEMFGSAIYSPAEDGQRYEAFATSKDRIVNDEDGSACMVWLRSAGANYSNVFCMVSTSGSASGGNAGYSYGVALGFCI